MALSTYSGLKTSVADWLHRGDLTAAITDFVTLCEADYTRRLRLATMETRVTATFNEGYEDLPSDFLEMREIKMNTSPVQTLQYVTPQWMTEKYTSPSDSGTPEFYTIVGTRVRCNTTPSSLTAEMVYYKRIPALSDSQTTNWMLTNHPDVYLWGSLLQAAPYINNDQRIPVWGSKYEKAIAEVELADKRARWGSPLTARNA